jgi:hypothetical protein
MKALILWKFIVLISTFSLFYIGCSDDNPTEPNYDTALTANWKISKLSWEGLNDNGSYDQSQLDSNGTVWSLTLNSDKTAELTTNYCCALADYTGTWSATTYELTLKLSAQGSMDIIESVYQFVIKGSKLVLNWSETGTIYYAEFIKQ